MKSLAVFVSALLLSAGAASAADLVIPPPPGPVVVAEPAKQAGFDWDRFYGGIQGGAWFSFGLYDTDFAFDTVRAAAIIGRNIAIGNRMVVGVEAVGGFYIYPGEVIFEAYGIGRVGVLLGDRALMYGAAGLGYDFDPVGGGPFMVLGGGLEVGVLGQLSVRAETLALRYPSESFSFLSTTMGFVWHFGD